MRRAGTAGTLLVGLIVLFALGSPVEAQSRHHSTHGRSNYGHSSGSHRSVPYYRSYRPTYYRSGPYHYPGRGYGYGYYGPRFYYPYYYPSFGFYYGSPFYSGYSSYGYPYYAPYAPYASYGGVPRPWAELRIEVKPRQAKVFVDGYYAGVVDDYDGTFQRLNLAPGSHSVSVYLEGYRTIEETMYLSPGNSYRIKQAMVPLAPGEAQEPPPQPNVQEQEQGTAEAMPPEGPGPVPAPPMQAPPPPPRAPTMPATTPPAVTSAPSADFGMLEVRVQPQGVRLVIDGEPWPATDTAGPISVHVTQGRHRVEIQKDGYRSFAGEVVVSAGRTTTLNVKLSSSAERPDASSLVSTRPLP
jgi:PEGA domain